jgi:hypothetical protein
MYAALLLWVHFFHQATITYYSYTPPTFANLAINEIGQLPEAIGQSQMVILAIVRVTTDELELLLSKMHLKSAH